MTIDDQIKDEKLQYDINREAAKISALSSGKTEKYEYLTGEKILPSNQKQIIEQTKFAYSPLEKAFEKKRNYLRTRKKTSLCLEALKPKELKAIEEKSDGNEKHLKYKVFNELSIERVGEIYNISKEIDFDNLTYRFKASNLAPINFIDFTGPMHIYN